MWRREEKFPEMWYLKKAYLMWCRLDWIYISILDICYSNVKSLFGVLHFLSISSKKFYHTVPHMNHFTYTYYNLFENANTSSYSLFLIICIIFHKLFWMNVDISLMCMFNVIVFNWHRLEFTTWINALVEMA